MKTSKSKDGSICRVVLLIEALTLAIIVTAQWLTGYQDADIYVPQLIASIYDAPDVFREDISEEYIEPDMEPDAKCSIDTSMSSKGIVIARCVDDKPHRFQIKTADTVRTFPILTDGSANIYPLTMGDGEYVLRIMEMVSKTTGFECYSCKIDFKEEDEFAPCLSPNIYANYNEDMDLAEIAKRIADSAWNELHAAFLICQYVNAHVQYDYEKAKTVAPPYIPDPEETLHSGKGICFDSASLTASMLRSVGIPTKLVIGDYINTYSLGQERTIPHAWNEVYIDGEWIMIDTTASGTNVFKCGQTSKNRYKPEYYV